MSEINRNLQIKMIELLIEKDKYDYGCTTKIFMKSTGAQKKEVRQIIKNLKQAGMIEACWCIDDDGFLSGKAYFLTYRATQWSIREWLQELKKDSLNIA